MKKLISSILVGVLLVCIGICCVGCQNNQGSESQSYVYLYVRDNQGNHFYLGKDQTMRSKTLEYDYDNNVLTFSTKAYYESGEECLMQSVVSFDMKTIKLNEPGEYKLQHYYENSKNEPFELTVKVKEKTDERLIPIIEIEPGENCVEYVTNEKYVYRYTGDMQIPTYINAYDPVNKQLLGKFEFKFHMFNLSVVEGMEDSKLVGVGVYQVDIILATDTIGSEDSMYQEASLQGILIQIIN